MDVKDERAEVDGLHVEQEPTCLSIHCQQPARMGRLLILFGVILIELGLYFPLETQYFWMLAPAGGAFLLYGLITMINKWILLVTNKDLSVRYGPIPFYHRRRRVPSGEIQQLYVRSNPRYSQYRGNLNYCILEAVLRDDQRISLVYDLPYHSLHSIELQVESWLKLQDIRVEGEVFPEMPLNAQHR